MDDDKDSYKRAHIAYWIYMCPVILYGFNYQFVRKLPFIFELLAGLMTIIAIPITIGYLVFAIWQLLEFISPYVAKAIIWLAKVPLPEVNALGAGRKLLALIIILSPYLLALASACSLIIEETSFLDQPYGMKYPEYQQSSRRVLWAYIFGIANLGYFFGFLALLLSLPALFLFRKSQKLFAYSLTTFGLSIVIIRLFWNALDVFYG